MEKRVLRAEEDAMAAFPVGSRFNPTDEELIVYYLRRKVLGLPFHYNMIKEVDLYSHHPTELLDANIGPKENRVYLFTPRNRKYPHGKKPDRMAKDGFWKATAADKPVKDSYGNEIGHKRPLAFFKGTNPNGKKTNWLMHEYTIKESRQPLRGNANNTMLDDWVLCRVYLKTKNSSSTSPLDEEDEELMDDDKSPSNSLKEQATPSNSSSKQALEMCHPLPPPPPQRKQFGPSASDQSQLMASQPGGANCSYDTLNMAMHLQPSNAIHGHLVAPTPPPSHLIPDSPSMAAPFGDFDDLLVVPWSEPDL